MDLTPEIYCNWVRDNIGFSIEKYNNFLDSYKPNPKYPKL